MKRAASVLAATIAFCGISSADAKAHERAYERAAPEEKTRYLARSALWNRANDGIYLMGGLESLRQGQLGFSVGWGVFGGLNQGIEAYTATAGYGGPIFGKDFSLLGLSWTAGILLGYGFVGDVTPAFTFSNTYGFTAYEPRLGVTWSLGERAKLGVEAAYLVTSNQAVATGPALRVRIGL